MSPPPMAEQKDADKTTCEHRQIVPHSGGYYLQCTACRTLWVHKEQMGKENDWAAYKGQPIYYPMKWVREG